MTDEIQDQDQQEIYHDEVDAAAILRDYHRKQIVLHMIGPVISLLVHLVALTAISQIWGPGDAHQSMAPLEIISRELDPVEIDPQDIEDISDIEPDTATDVAPSIEPPPAPAMESTDMASVDSIPDAPVADIGGLDEMAFAESALAVSFSPVTVSSAYAVRESAASRGAAVSRYGGDSRTEDAVIKALDWLQRVREPNGSWANSPAHTGLALLCFLAHGDKPGSPRYGVTVQEGLQWLANAAMTTPRDRPMGGRAYSHGIAAYALAEAYALTQIPFLRAPMERSLDLIIRGQQEGGGYDYNYKQGDRWDLSVGGWQIQAIKAGISAGATNPGLKEAVDKSIKWLKEDTYRNGKFGYSSPGSGGNMTGVGVVCLQLLGEARSPEVRAAIETIATERLALYERYNKRDSDFFKTAGRPLYGWYYDTQAMFNHQGRQWRNWNRVFKDVLVREQMSDGSWEFEADSAHWGGKSIPHKVLATTWACLQLEVYYRYLPTFDISRMVQTSTRPAAESIIDEIQID